jgi:hypothetical protein
MSWSQPKFNPDEAHSTQENEVLCQNSIWSFARLLPKHVPLGNLWNAPSSSEVCPTWSLSSSVQFNILDEQIPMAVFPSPRPSLYTERNGERFVDDVTLWETSLTSELREVQE